MGAGDVAFDRRDLLLFLLLVAAAENGQAGQGEAEQPAPALADLGAVDDDDVAPLGRRLEIGGGGVETLQPGRIVGDRPALHQRLEKLWPLRRLRRR